MSTAADLKSLLGELVAWDLEEHPVRATALGAPGHDDRLGDFSAPAIEARQRRERELLAQFQACSDEGVSVDDQIDRALAVSELSGRMILHDWADWQRSPDGYAGACLYGVFQLFLHRLRPDADLVSDAVARLAEVPAVLDAARANLDPALAVEPLVRRAVGMCQAGVAYFREFLPAEVGDDGLRATLAQAGEGAAAAMLEFAGFLDELAGRARGSFALGEERYSRLLREREGLGYGLSGLQDRGRAALDTLATDMSARAEGIAGTPDFRAVIAEANEDHGATPEEMRAGYEEWTNRAREFLVERELVTFPAGERCEVVPSPSFQRPMLAVASYMRPPAFTDSRVGHFFVPFPPPGASDDEVQARLAMNSRWLIPSIAVHEAYPGHHWHLAVAAGNERAVRKVYGTPYFAEGWGLYTEQMMREEGFFPDPRMELLQLDMRLFRACRIVVDTALHAGEMTVEEAVAFMEERAGLTEPVARAEVLRYCAWPTQAPAYLTGSIEIERMRDAYLAEARGDLRSFHDTIAASGVLPLALAERAVMEG
ncbi:MAG: DUF885 domain-containing protein [Actinobacteria bacterium]|nr:DUF885 domain-containing protein [Actinomycetota bacterium]